MPELFYLGLIFPLLTAGLTLFPKNRTSIAGINILGSLLTSAVLGALIYQIFSQGALQSGLFYADSLSAVLLLVVGMLTFTTTLFSVSYMERELLEGKIDLKALKRYYVLLNVFSFTMNSVVLVENLGLMWVAIEATTLASALLVTFYFDRPGIEAAWKYVMVCTVGICLALLGTILLYHAQVSVGAGGEGALSWLALKTISSQLDPKILKLAFVFILIGYGTKIGLAPMHTWLPDAHSQAPSPISGLLSGALLSCAMYVLMRNMIIVKAATGLWFVQCLLVVFGLLSVVIVIPFILVQHDVKRLLAYSSVEHMGLITLALGVGTPLAVYGALLHIFNHAVAKSALFFLAGLITQQYHTKCIMRIRGIMTTMPVAGALFLLLMLCITGTPPLGVFVSKFIIVWAIFQQGQAFLGGVLLLLLAGIFAGMMYYCLLMVFSKTGGMAKAGSPGKPAATALFLSVTVIVVAGLYRPQWMDVMLYQAVTVLTGG